MAATRTYEQGEFQFEFTPKQEDPFAGLLLTRMADQEPYAADVNLSKRRSRNEYVGEASEICGADEQELKKALIGLCAMRREEVNAAETSEQPADETGTELEVAQEKIDELVGYPEILDRLVETIATFSGVVGERPMLKLILLAASSVQLDLLPNGKPLAANLMLTAAAGRGKNYLFDAVARVLPPEFYYAFESSSAKAFYYAAENNSGVLKHRWVYPNEAEATDQVIELFRPLLSGGKARHNTVNKDSHGTNVWREYELEGPVVLTIATVRNKLDAQLQTRMLVAGLEDYEGRVAAHSGAISGQLDPGYSGTDYGQEIAAWQAALRSLTSIRRVVVPISHEGFRFDRDDVSHGARLWTNFLGLMCAHVWLEQRNRQIVDLSNGEKAIVATPEDYEAAYRIFEATCERSVVNLSGPHRRILDALYDMHQEARDLEWPVAPDGYSQRKIAERSGIPQSTISDNKTFLVKSLKLLRETSDGLALIEDADTSWWRKGDVLAGFPTPEQVRAWWSGEDGPPDPDTPGHAGRPNDPAEKDDGNVVNGDRDIPGRPPQAAGQPLQDDADQLIDRGEDADDRHNPGQDNALGEQDSSSEEGLTGLTGVYRHSDPSLGDGSASGAGRDALPPKSKRILGAEPQFIDTSDGTQALLPELQAVERVALDVETTGLDPRQDRVRLLSLATEKGTWLIDCFEVDPSPLFPVLSEKELVIHNALFDLGMLSEMGFELGEAGRIFDTMVSSQLSEGDYPGDKEEDE